MRSFTLLTPAMLPQARVLAESLRRRAPGWTHELVLLGHRDHLSGLDATARSATEMLQLDLEELLAWHDVEDACALMLPRLLSAYLQMDPGPVVHLPATAWALGDLEPVERALAERSLMLVPRSAAELPDDGLGPSQAQLEQAGRIEETLIGVRGEEADGFLRWWEGLIQRALGSLEGGAAAWRPEDRPWLARHLELAPALFSAAVPEEPGLHLSMWNLHAHRLTGSAEAPRIDGQEPLRLLELPGFEPDRPHRLSRSASRVRVSRSPVLRELCVAYAAELQRAGWSAGEQRGEIGERLPNGLIYDETLHELRRTALILGEPLDDPFDERGCEELTGWLQGRAPRGAAHGINRYVFYRVARERRDVVRAYPDLDGADGPGYLAWCRQFGSHELSIPEMFMPAPPPAGPPPPPRPQPAPHAERGEHAEQAERPTQMPQRPPAGSPEVAGDPHRAAGADRGGQAAEAGELPAVRVTGYLGHTLGLGAAARGYVRALQAAGVPTSTSSVPLHHLELPVELHDGYGQHTFADLARSGGHGFDLVAVNADELPGLVSRLGESYFQGPRIGIWGWETDSIPARWSEAFGLVEEIWVYSQFMARNIGAVSPVPVRTLPPPVDLPVKSTRSAKQSPIEMPDGYLFLFIFDYLSTIERKNPVGLIEAFKLAFADGEGPQLLIKTINAPLRPLAEEEVLWAAHGRSDIRVVDRSLDAAELGALMAACDCYVSLHRSEGFGLTMAEAMALGKPVIATGYSGNVDFMSAENSHLVDHTIVRVGPDCEIYPADGRWAQPSVEHAASLMRRVIESPRETEEIAARGRRDVARTLSAEVTGAAMLRRLRELEATQSFAGSASGGAPPGLSTSSHS